MFIDNGFPASPLLELALEEVQFVRNSLTQIQISHHRKNLSGWG